MKKLILGIGNTLNRDEGLGVHAIARLRVELPQSSGLEIVDGGTLGLGLLSVIETCSHLLVIDAINAGKDGGAVIELQAGEIPLFKKMKMSGHQTTFHDVLGFAFLRGKLPQHIRFLGIQPADTGLGTGLSDRVERAIPELIARAKEIVGLWQSGQ